MHYGRVEACYEKLNSKKTSLAEPWPCFRLKLPHLKHIKVFTSQHSQAVTVSVKKLALTELPDFATAVMQKTLQQKQINKEFAFNRVGLQSCHQLQKYIEYRRGETFHSYVI